MSATIDFSVFSFSAEQIRNINELVYEGIAQLPELSELFTMYDGIVYDKEIGFLTGGGLVGTKKQGCNPEPQDWSVGSRKVVWTPKAWEVYIDECASDLENTMVVYAQNKGVRMDDLTDTDYIAIVVMVLLDAVKEMMHRLIWFGDTDAEDVDFNSYPTAAATEQTTGEDIVGTVYEGVTATTASAVKCCLADGTIVYLAGSAAEGKAADGKTYYSKDTEHKTTINEGGNLTEGVDEDYFNVLDGLFKQLRAIVALDGSVKVTIAANAQSTKAEQLSYLTPDRAYQLLSDMWYKANIKLRQRKGECRFYVSQSVADKYEQYLIGKGIESTYVNLVDGVQALKFNGIPVIPLANWDANIQAYFDLGDTYDAPHRAILTTKQVLAVGTPSEKAYDKVDVWFDKTSRKNYVLLQDKLDAKVLSDKMLVYAE